MSAVPPKFDALHPHKLKLIMSVTGQPVPLYYSFKRSAPKGNADTLYARCLTATDTLSEYIKKG